MANKIKELREYYGMSQRDVADLCNTSQSSIGDAEAGRHVPNVYMAKRIAKALRTTSDELFWEERENDRG